MGENKWMSDYESEYGSDSKELTEERFQEEQERIQELESSVQKLFAAEPPFCSGNAERISYTMEILEGFELPLHTFQQHGIAALIEEYAAHTLRRQCNFFTKFKKCRNSTAR
ncbi:unnamed protein product [Caenorhabditis brenneri]